MNSFTKNIRGFVDFGKQAEPKNPCVVECRFKRRRFKRKVALREYFRADRPFLLFSKKSI